MTTMLGMIDWRGRRRCLAGLRIIKKRDRGKQVQGFIQMPKKDICR